MKWTRLRLRDITIRRKLVLIVMLTTLTALLLSTVAYIGNELVTARQELRGDLSATAAILGPGCAAALASQDPKSATETLAPLKAKVSIAAAFLYTPDRQRLAMYLANAAAKLPRAEELGRLDGAATASWLFQGRFAHLWQPIVAGGHQLGVIHLALDTEPLAARIRRQIAVAVIVLLASALVA